MVVKALVEATVLSGVFPHSMAIASVDETNLNSYADVVPAFCETLEFLHPSGKFFLKD